MVLVELWLNSIPANEQERRKRNCKSTWSHLNSYLFFANDSGKVLCPYIFS